MLRPIEDVDDSSLSHYCDPLQLINMQLTWLATKVNASGLSDPLHPCGVLGKMAKIMQYEGPDVSCP